MESKEKQKYGVFRESETPDLPEVKGYSFDEPFDANIFFSSYLTTGFQATQIGRAIKIINEMRTGKIKTKIYLGYTSNMVSSGIRETICFLVKNKMVDVLVTTAGGIEEDLIKCLGKTHIADFNIDGKLLYNKGYNRAGNLIIPNKNYCMFEEWLWPILDEMINEQNKNKIKWTPSKMINLLGKKIENKESIYYWASKNNIPVYCPALTDGSIGDMIYFHSFKNEGLILDIVEDLREINNETKYSKRTGMIVLGGGTPKHHICNANLMRNGADYAVYINTGIEADGSDSGASPDEAVSWGKIKENCNGNMVKVWCDATIAFPIIVSQTFMLKK